MTGKGNLNLTGQMGDVMKESAQAALSYVRSQAKRFNIDEKLFSETDIHIHIPAGAVPKDGPSAGVALFVALISLLTDKTTKSDVAMTGEITLRGLVLPVGGIKEKVLAAVRAGIKTVILPEKNQKDIDEIPEMARKKVKFQFIKKMDEVIPLALNNR
jgi:ATP-dependent Lon protease